MLTPNIVALKELVMAILREVERIEAASNRDARRPELNSGVSLNDEVRRFEVALIREALNVTRGHQRHASSLLNIKPTTLNAKIKRYDIRF
jgi:DNA-binding NtrC family response regulator